MKFNINWMTKAHLLKDKEFDIAEKAFNFWRKKSEATLWAGERGNFEDYFRISWITDYGNLKTEKEIHDEFEKFIKYIEHMLKI